MMQAILVQITDDDFSPTDAYLRLHHHTINREKVIYFLLINGFLKISIKLSKSLDEVKGKLPIHVLLLGARH